MAKIKVETNKKIVEVNTTDVYANMVIDELYITFVKYLKTGSYKEKIKNK